MACQFQGQYLRKPIACQLGLRVHFLVTEDLKMYQPIISPKCIPYHCKSGSVQQIVKAAVKYSFVEKNGVAGKIFY